MLAADDEPLAEEISRSRHLAGLLAERFARCEFRIEPANRGRLKQALIKVGFPVEDLAGYASGDDLAFSLRSTMLSGKLFALRAYQQAAADVFHAGGSKEVSRSEPVIDLAHGDRD